MQEFSEFDQQLCNLLQFNSRATIESLAQQLNSSTAKVKKRLTFLEDNHIILFYGYLINFSRANWGNYAMILVDVESQYIDRVLNQLLPTPYVYEIYQLASEYNLAVYGWFENKNQLQEFLSNELSLIKGVKAFNALIFLRGFFKGEMTVGDPPIDDYDIQLDDTDLALARVLFQNGRAPLTAYSNYLNIPKEEIELRISKLTKLKIIRPWTHVFSAKPRTGLQIMIQLRVLPIEHTNVLNKILQLSPHFVDETTSRSSIWALFDFNNSTELQNLIEKHIRPIKGIQEIDPHIILGYYVSPPQIHERIA